MKNCINCKYQEAMQGKRFCSKCSMGLTLDQKMQAMKQGKYGECEAEKALGALAPELTRILIALLYRPCEETRDRARAIIKEVDQTSYFSYRIDKDDAVSQK